MLLAFDRVASRLSRNALLLATLVGVALLGLADQVAGYEISFSLFYLAPIAVASWYGGRTAGLLVALASATAWLAADVGSGHVYSSRLIPAWNMFMRLCLFSIFAWLLHALRTLLETARQLARADPLTGLDNRRAFFDRLQFVLALAARERRPLTLAYLDVDDFKGVNDAHGHAAGDQVLRLVGRTVLKSLRRTDAVGRVGGDEFALLLPDTDRAGAEHLIAKTREALYHAFRTESARPTFSIGAITFMEPTNDAEHALSAADALMYQVKSRGKDGIAFGQEPPA
jgi:diguanylate cyclase (GGDEF)-like protein